MKTHIKFPTISQEYAGMMSDDPVKLDGQKVLFDKKVVLLPVELETTNDETNGTNT